MGIKLRQLFLRLTLVLSAYGRLENIAPDYSKWAVTIVTDDNGENSTDTVIIVLLSFIVICLIVAVVSFGIFKKREK